MIYIVPGDNQEQRIARVQEIAIVARDLYLAARGALTMREAADKARVIVGGAK